MIMRDGMYPAITVASPNSATRIIVPPTGATIIALLMGSTIGCALTYGTKNPYKKRSPNPAPIMA